MDVRNKIIVRNTVLNFFGLVVPLAVGFVTIPMVVRTLGNDRFGILALVWVVFGYFGLFDLGLGRTTALVVWGALSLRVMPALRTRPVLHGKLVRPLFSFSGWLGLSSILYAVTSSMDRLVIGSLITVEAVTFYSAPYEAINRVGVVPGSLSMVLFPAFSYLDAGGRTDRAETLFARSMKFLLLSTGPVFLLLMFFAGDFLRLWLGADFAAKSAFVVQVLAAGFFINTVIAVPNNYLQGIGRVDIAPKYQAFELVAFTAMTWAGAKFWGIKGVAVASAVRLVAFTLFLSAASFKAGRVRLGFVWKKGLAGSLAALGLFAAGLAANAVLGFGVWGAGVLVLAFAGAAYFRLLDGEERAFIAGLLGIRRGAGRKDAAETEDRG